MCLGKLGNIEKCAWPRHRQIRLGDGSRHVDAVGSPPATRMAVGGMAEVICACSRPRPGVWHGRIWHGRIWHGHIWHGRVLHDHVWRSRGQFGILSLATLLAWQVPQAGLGHGP